MRSDLHDPLEIFGIVIPPIVVAERVRGEEVVDRVRGASRVGKNVVGLPLEDNLSALATTGRFLKDASPLAGKEPSPPEADWKTVVDTDG